MDLGQKRTISGNTVISPDLPRLHVQAAIELIYLGNLQLVIENSHYIEEFLFYKTSPLGHITRLLIVHFEGALDHHEVFVPDPGENIQLGEHKYCYHVSFLDIKGASDIRDADVSRVTNYIREQGFTFGGNFIVQNFQRLVGDENRNIFKIIYIENNEDEQLNPERLAQDKAAAQALLARAQVSFQVGHG